MSWYFFSIMFLLMLFFLHWSELISNFDGSLFSSFVAQQNMCMTHVSWCDHSTYDMIRILNSMMRLYQLNHCDTKCTWISFNNSFDEFINAFINDQDQVRCIHDVLIWPDNGPIIAASTVHRSTTDHWHRSTTDQPQIKGKIPITKVWITDLGLRSTPDHWYILWGISCSPRWQWWQWWQWQWQWQCQWKCHDTFAPIASPPHDQESMEWIHNWRNQGNPTGGARIPGVASSDQGRRLGTPTTCNQSRSMMSLFDHLLVRDAWSRARSFSAASRWS